MKSWQSRAEGTTHNKFSLSLSLSRGLLSLSSSAWFFLVREGHPLHPQKNKRENGGAKPETVKEKEGRGENARAVAPRRARDDRRRDMSRLDHLHAHSWRGLVRHIITCRGGACRKRRSQGVRSGACPTRCRSTPEGASRGSHRASSSSSDRFSCGEPTRSCGYDASHSPWCTRRDSSLRRPWKRVTAWRKPPGQ